VDVSPAPIQVQTPVVAVILAGGLGLRFGGEMPKQLTTINGAPVIDYVFRAFDEHPSIDEMIIPAHPEWEEQVRAAANKALRHKPWKIVQGGATRNESVLAAVNALHIENGTIIVHDGARPLVSHALITASWTALSGHDAVLPVVPITDLVIGLDKAEGDFHFVPRERLRCGQTPQVFQYTAIKQGLNALPAAQLGAYATLYEALQASRNDLRICLIDGDPVNLKITVPHDGVIAETLLRQRM